MPQINSLHSVRLIQDSGRATWDLQHLQPSHHSTIPIFHYSILPPLQLFAEGDGLGDVG